MTLFCNRFNAFGVLFASLVVVTGASHIPTYGQFNLTTKNGSICLIANMDCEVAYHNHTTMGSFVPTNAIVSGDCAAKNANESRILLEWNYQSSRFSMKIQFKKDSSTSWSVSLIAVSRVVNNVTITESSNKTHMFSAADGSYYQCLRKKEVSLSSKTTVIFSQVKLLPFLGKKGIRGPVTQCAADYKDGKESDSDIVPIVVGCVLGGLIVILLITYLFGRSKNKGYEQI